MKRINYSTLNIIANILSLIVSFIISFFLTPYITKHAGIEAYGLIGLANNFTSYITILTAAFNTMASRFIIIELHKDHSQKANKYFSSVLGANTIIAFITVIIGIILSLNIEKVINVSEGLVHDATVTFLLVFINFAISLIFSVFGIVYYYKNKLFVGAFNNMVGEFIRVAAIILIFTLIGVKIQYSILTLIISSIFINAFSYFYTQKNIPQLKISFKFFEIKKILEIVAAGIWNSITKLSQILLNGLDLIIVNLFINGTVMGVVSLGKHFSSILISVISSVSDTFLPKFLKAYATDEKELHKEFFKSTKILGYFSCMLFSLFFIFCQDFFKLWVPEQDSVFLSRIAFLSLLSIIISGPVYSMFSIYTVINKVRPQAIATLVMAVLSTGTVFFLLKFTNLGVYAIVGTSTVYGVLKNLTYNMYCLKKYVHLSIKKCYIIIIKNLLTMASLIFINTVLKSLFVINSFSKLIIAGMASFVLCNLIYFIIAINTNDKKAILSFVKTKFFLKKRED